MPTVKSGWSGGQYSLFRFGLGLYLAIHFSALVPYGAEIFSSAGVLPNAADSPLYGLFPNFLALADGPLVVVSALLAGVLGACLFAAGLADRVAAFLCWYLWACLYGRNPLIANPSLPFVGWMLLAHLFVPAAPYGSIAARDRADPAGGWLMPAPLFGAAWIVMAAGYSYSGYTKLVSPSWLDGSALAEVLESPLARPSFLRDFMLALPAPLLRAFNYGTLGAELLFAPLALLRRVRPWLWLLLLSLHLGLILFVDFADLSLGMVLLHAFTFDPDWVRPRGLGLTERLYYDGHCALCHNAVRFLLSEDRSGLTFRFAPLGSQAFLREVPDEMRVGLPDSVVVRDAGGQLLVRSDAVRHLLLRLGGAWGVLGRLLGAVPRPLRDAAYDGVAGVRVRVFGRALEACPIMAPGLRARFDLDVGPA